MQKNQGNYEKVLLVLMALVALAVAGLTIWKSQGFADTLQEKRVTPKEELGDIPLESATAATKRLATVFDWKAPEIDGKKVPLNKSVLLVLKDGTLFDLYSKDPNAPNLRDPITNKWLIDNNIPDILSPNVADLDPDKDGFTNLEEFNAQTNPMDPASKPEATQKLFLVQRITNDYILQLASSIMPVQVQRLKPEPKISKFVTEGADFGFEKGESRFRFVSFEKKSAKDDKVGEKDVSELTILDLATNQEVTLVRNEPKNLAEYEARFEFRLGTIQEITQKKGEDFQLPGTGQTYRVVEVEETHAVIAPVGADGSVGTSIQVPRG
ncbi:MAG: hypothetical protein KDK99_09685 [Verrucomicrobiales bacterium]|nr:hypothetical protein [Verrucomicrobiales bacterium]